MLVTDQQIDEVIEAVLKVIDTKPTLSTCLCAWRVHPDDMSKKRDAARRIRIEEHTSCPVHTQKGLVKQVLKGLLRYVTDQQGITGIEAYADVPDILDPNRTVTIREVGEWHSGH